LIITSILDIYSVMAPFNDVRVHMSAPLHCYTTKVRSVLVVLGDCPVKMMTWWPW
jgi:hypothetical protein